MQLPGTQQTLVKTSIVDLNSFNRTMGTIANPTFTFGKGLIAGATELFDEIWVEPLQVCVCRDWPTVSEDQNTFQVITYLAGTCPQDPRHGLLKTYRIAPGMYAFPEGQAVANSWLLWLKRNLPSTIDCGFDPCTFRLIMVNNDPTLNYRFFFPTYACVLFGQPLYSQRLLTDVLISDSPVRMELESVLLLHTDLPLKHCSIVGNLETDSRKLLDTRESNILVKIPLDSVQISDRIRWERTDEGRYRFRCAANQINTMTTYFTDDLGRSIAPACNWTLQLQISFFKANKDPLIEIVQLLRSLKDHADHNFLARSTEDEDGEEEATDQDIEPTPMWANF